MNLHQIVSGAIGSVNPFIPIIVQQSTGYTQDANFHRVPTYNNIPTTGQVQALTGKDLRQLEALNVQGVNEAVYLNGNFEGVFRVLGKGGDLLIFNGYTYLVMAVLERWSDWCKLAVVMQMDSTP
ncbi:MAG: hypothetical protein EPN62_00795 [Candidimonas sp.]|nr:MAG: hypothetical protein EPN77_01795 [Candidimonas sp.]TAM26868.1 MAG: hypothetical protein EPN62_00795 [Candidimonas sp.]